MTVSRIEEAVKAKGYTTIVVEGRGDTSEPASTPAVDPRTLPPDLASAFDEARTSGRGVLLHFSGKG